jgi:hypothetical protein
MKKIILLINTLKYLKFKQFYFRLFYFIRARYRKLIHFKYTFLKVSNATPLKLDDSIENHYSSCTEGSFNFLNLDKKFEEQVEWNYAQHGKLWTYNLTYFEYLKEREDVTLIYDFIEHIESVKDGLEPFPISLRGLSWIKFLTKYHIEDKKIDNSLYAQYYILLDNLEYHLLGNHLLENGFSLLFGAYYFKDETLYNKAKEILVEELDEQMLKDGGHFELSPMYHQLMLFRVLDSINLLQNNLWKDQELLELLSSKAEIMLGWLENITYKDGSIPLLNDSANHIAPTSKELFNYADRLKIKTLHKKLKESGYRKIVQERYELIVDVGEVGASYIPGHAHADTFNFELQVDGKPFIVDSGLSTYETNERRFYERSTKAHNTVEILSNDSSEVWSGFRVANRASVVALEERENFIKATHNGYKKQNILHTRSWQLKEDRIVIEDSLSKKSQAIFRLHFHPSITQDFIEQTINSHEFTLYTYHYAQEFNKTKEALVLEIPFEKNLKVEIKL